jgi:hypothetical protein
VQRTYHLIVMALAEAGTGLLGLAWPSGLLALLLGSDQAVPEAIFSARICGAALFALSIAWWVGRESPDRLQRGLLLSVLVYDLAASAILAYTGYVVMLAGIALWPAVALHVALAVWCVVCLLGESRHGK